VHYTTAEIDAVLKVRPPDYRDRLFEARLRRQGDWHTFDADHPAYAALQERHKGDEKIPVRRRKRVSLPDRQFPAMPDPAVWGPQRWSELHRFALAATPAAVAEFVKRWGRRVPCGTCRGHLNQYVRANPPEAAADAFAWSVDLHNTVNGHLERPTMTVEAARALWSAAAVH
jgi:hypothetical protein